jgi:hypothetical protein
MKSKVFLLALMVFPFLLTKAQIDLSKKIPGIQYESAYTFSGSVEMEFDFYDRKGKHEMMIPYFSYFNSDFTHTCIKHVRGRTVYQTIFDMPNNNCLILLGEENNLTGSAAVMKDNEGRILKELPLIHSGETRQILDYQCTRYTFEAEEFTGEMWITDAIDLPNDVGVFKASKTAKYYQTLSEKGFVMEITSITPKGRKTVMKTTGISPSTTYAVQIPEPFGRSLNKIDYFAY